MEFKARKWQIFEDYEENNADEVSSYLNSISRRIEPGTTSGGNMEDYLVWTIDIGKSWTGRMRSDMNK